MGLKMYLTKKIQDFLQHKEGGINPVELEINKDGRKILL